MIDSNAIVAGVAEWLALQLAELEGRIYDHVPARKPLGLPDAVVELARSATRIGGGEQFAMFDIQQALMYTADVDVSFMVDNADTAAAAHQLRDFESRLIRAVLSDADLGGRVTCVAPELAFDFASPYVEYEDGTKGREMTMTITVGDLVEATH